MNTDAATPHRRYNALTGEWVLVSPHRTQRPWQGQRESTAADTRPAYDPGCYLCPGNERAGGQRNPDYTDVYVFDNDFPALLPQPAADTSPHPLLRSMAVGGTCRVICYSPRHDLALAGMDDAAIARVVDAWSQQHRELSETHDWVQIFENRGAAMGCSNPHPHGQIWALDALPNEARAELATQSRYLEQHGSTLLGDYAELELERGERVVFANEHWIAVVPWWAVWPFETLLIARGDVARIDALDAAASATLASALGRLFRAYDRVFATPFPYSFGWHSAPSRTAAPGWRLHAHVYPPLLRSADVRKFMVGFELLGEPQRDLTPEAACQTLVQCLDP